MSNNCCASSPHLPARKRLRLRSNHELPRLLLLPPRLPPPRPLLPRPDHLEEDVFKAEEGDCANIRWTLPPPAADNATDLSTIECHELPPEEERDNEEEEEEKEEEEEEEEKEEEEEEGKGAAAKGGLKPMLLQLVVMLEPLKEEEEEEEASGCRGVAEGDIGYKLLLACFFFFDENN